MDLPAWMNDVLAEDPNAFEFERAWKPNLLEAKAARLELAQPGIEFFMFDPDALAQTGAAVTGVMEIPVIPILYANTDSEPYATETLRRRLFGRDRALTLTTFYEEMSRGLFTVDGEVLDWARVGNDDSYYEAGDKGPPPFLGHLLEDAIAAVDSLVDFSRFDANGDGYVDVVSFIQPKEGGECENSTAIWSHRWTVGDALKQPGATISTDDGVEIYDYVIQPAFECEGGPIELGVFAHELGHALGLPDLYAVPPDGSQTAANAGIGEWGLMGYGSWNTPESPAHMSAWSKVELGWLQVRYVDQDVDDLLLAPVSAGTALRIDQPRTTGEYFLLENRRRFGSDRNLKGTGLLIWHVDSVQIAARRVQNTVQNVTGRKGVDLEEADGEAHLDDPRGIADEGDPYPGSQGVTGFGPATSPSSGPNSGGGGTLSIADIRDTADQISMDVRLRSPTVAAEIRELERVGFVEERVAAEAARAEAETETGFGSIAVVEFAGALQLEDWLWLEGNGFRIRDAEPGASVIVVDIPLAYEGDPRAANERIVRFSTQLRRR